MALGSRISLFSITLALSAFLRPVVGAAHPLESIPPDEAAATQKIAAMIEESVRSAARGAPAHRDAHAKAHGCVSAKFEVLPHVPSELSVGVFQIPRSYQAWIRFSNGSGRSQDDSVGDGRGMAIKLLDVDSESTTQDFLLINHPVFFVRNAADYVEFQEALSQNDSPTRFFFPGLNPRKFRIHEAAIAKEILGKKMTNPLEARYWSMTPYLFGNEAVKFSTIPCSPTRATQSAEARGPDFLRENMKRQLYREDACFIFLVQRQGDPAKMPLEDPTIEWEESASPFIPVARITIPRQRFDSPDQMKFCENLSYTPWHHVPEHRPLGGINRVRKTVYETISRVRHELNGVERHEPQAY